MEGQTGDESYLLAHEASGGGGCYLVGVEGQVGDESYPLAHEASGGGGCYLVGVEGQTGDESHPLAHEASGGGGCYLVGVEGQTGDGSYPLAHEAVVVLDGAQSVTRLVVDADALLHRPAACTQSPVVSTQSHSHQWSAGSPEISKH